MITVGAHIAMRENPRSVIGRVMAILCGACRVTTVSGVSAIFENHKLVLVDDPDLVTRYDEVAEYWRRATRGKWTGMK